MSYILEALRKAERERKLGNVPSIDATLDGVTAPRRGSRWPTLIATGLIANATLLGALYLYWQYRPPATTASQLDAEPPPRVRAPAQATAADPRAPLEAEPPPQSRPLHAIQVEETPAAPSAKLPSPPLSPIPEPLVALEPATPPVVVEEPRVAMNEEAPLPPLLEDLPAEFRSKVPALDLTVHVYSDTPSQRFIFVNNRRYGEGQDTQEGARVERIQQNGIVLSFQGREFFLPGRW